MGFALRPHTPARAGAQVRPNCLRAMPHWPCSATTRSASSSPPMCAVLRNDVMTDAGHRLARSVREGRCATATCWSSRPRCLALWPSCLASPRVAPPVVQTLPNGMRVVLFVRPGLPIVQVQLKPRPTLRAEGRAAISRSHRAAAAPGHDFAQCAGLRRRTRHARRDLRRECEPGRAAQVAARLPLRTNSSLLELMSDAIVNPLFSDEAFEGGAPAGGNQRERDAEPRGNISRRTRAAALAFRPASVRPRHARRPRSRCSAPPATGCASSTTATGGGGPTVRCSPSPATWTRRARSRRPPEWFSRWGGKNAPVSAPVTATPRTGALLLDLPGGPAAEIRAFALAPGRGAPGYSSWLLATGAHWKPADCPLERTRRCRRHMTPACSSVSVQSAAGSLPAWWSSACAPHSARVRFGAAER